MCLDWNKPEVDLTFSTNIKLHRATCEIQDGGMKQILNRFLTKIQDGGQTGSRVQFQHKFKMNRK